MVREETVKKGGKATQPVFIGREGVSGHSERGKSRICLRLAKREEGKYGRVSPSRREGDRRTCLCECSLFFV